MCYIFAMPDPDDRPDGVDAPKVVVDGLDRRGEPRITIDLDVDYHEGGRSSFSFAADLSAGGIFVRSNAPERPGTLLSIEILLPGGPEPIRARGEVVWFDKDPEGKGGGMGIRFLDLEGEQRELVLAALARLRPDRG